MGTKHPEIYKALRVEFADTKKLVKEWTDKRTGERKMLDLFYITARQAMDRLDEVFGTENWWDAFETHERFVICRLTVVFPDGHEVTKQGFGGFAGMDDEGNDLKSGESDSFKRAAVKFGIGRYLYTANKPDRRSPRPDGKPQQATPARTNPREINALKERPKAGSAAIYYWCKAIGEHFSAPVVDNVNNLADAKGWPREWKQWDQKQIDEVVVRVARFIKRMKDYAGELDWINTDESATAPPPVSPADLELLRDQIWTAACDLFALKAPGIVLDPKAASEMLAHYSNGHVKDLPTCIDVGAMQTCLKELETALSLR